MAVVYKSKDLLLNRFVAVKILRGEFTDDEEFVKRFRVEAQAAASLNHPNIVSIYDVGKHDDMQYIVMEYINGITLKEYIGQMGALPWKEAVSIAVQICSALEQAHKNHIVHRDIKPHNILITKEGIAKVTDFGIARAVTSATITMVGSTIGSVHYFSPEQARGGFTDEKSDLYSLGVTIYEMVTGRVPFDGETPVAVALKHIQEKAERPADINPAIPKGLNDVILKAMKKDQNLRYQSATDMLNDLQKTLSEPNVKISGSNAEDYELPTRKMQAIGRDVEMPDEYEDEDTDTDGESFEPDSAENEKMKTGKSKKDKLSVWLGIATGLVVAGILFFIGIKPLLNAIMPDTTDVYVVQNYEGRDFNEVKDELSKYNITAVEDEKKHSDTVDQDVIISQNIDVGNKLKPGSSIKFTVSDGPELVQVPDVSNKEARVGEQLIRNENLDYTEEQEFSETVATGVIIRTEPAALEEVKPGETVTVFVSSGPQLEKVKVPNVVGLTRKEAEALILSSKLTLGTMLPSGQVSDVAKITKQYPLAETEVDEQTPVELTFEADGAGKTGQTGNGAGDTSGNQNGTPTDEAKTMLLNIELDPTMAYGDEVNVYVEATPSDTNQLTVVFNQSVAKSNFPFSIPVTLAKQGTTHIIVKLNNTIVQEGDY